MKLYISKKNNKVVLAIAKTKKDAKDIIGGNFYVDILDKNVDITKFHDGCYESDFHLLPALPISETEFVEIYGVSNLPK